VLQLLQRPLPEAVPIPAFVAPAAKTAPRPAFAAPTAKAASAASRFFVHTCFFFFWPRCCRWSYKVSKFNLAGLLLLRYLVAVCSRRQHRRLGSSLRIPRAGKQVGRKKVLGKAPVGKLPRAAGETRLILPSRSTWMPSAIWPTDSVWAGDIEGHAMQTAQVQLIVGVGSDGGQGLQGMPTGAADNACIGRSFIVFFGKATHAKKLRG